MPRFVLKRAGGGGAADADRIAALPGVRVLDRASDSVLLIEAEADFLTRHAGALAGWTASPETLHPLPGPFRVALKR